ncbi:glutamate ligase domain-containing protein [Chthonomonas calidirosea]|uniref:glutamate ligase domain-containing protein n=1 Tax=Chthonomonas calidirosea TaxID=454171 RepID=UPI003CCD49EA
MHQHRGRHACAGSTFAASYRDRRRGRKNLDFAPLTPALVRHAKALVLIGEAADRMEQTFRRGGFQAIHRAASLEEAVHTAHALASPGDIVILSPACASFDMFANFEARGAAFRSAVKALLKEQEP